MLFLQANTVAAGQTSSEVKEESLSIMDLIFNGGLANTVIIGILFLMLAIALYIYFERTFAISSAKRIDANFMNAIRDNISSGRIEAAKNLCLQYNSPVARLVSKGISRIGKPIDDIHKKIAYFPKKNNFYDGEGYFVINTEDYSITERFHKINEEIIDKIPFTKKLWTKYRTSYYSLKEKCEKNIKGKNFIASVSLQQQVEVYNKSDKNNYDIEYQIIITLPFSDISTFKANVSSKKELFKLNFPYNKNFWEKQNQLPLTEEIQFFLDKAHNQKEYRIISNF